MSPRPGQLEAVFGRIVEDWGRLDFVQHSIAYARKEAAKAITGNIAYVEAGYHVVA